jgi:hypothetical protein
MSELANTLEGSVVIRPAVSLGNASVAGIIELVIKSSVPNSHIFVDISFLCLNKLLVNIVSLYLSN